MATSTKATPKNAPVSGAPAQSLAPTDMDALLAQLEAKMEAKFQAELDSLKAQVEAAEERARVAEEARNASKKPMISLLEETIKVTPIKWKGTEDTDKYECDLDGYRITKSTGAYGYTIRGNGYGGTFWTSKEKRDLSGILGEFVLTASLPSEA